MTRTELISALENLITDPENFQNTPAKVREAISNLVASLVNTEDDVYTSPDETELEIGLGGAVNADCSTKKSFFINVNENVILDATGMKNGETYNFFFNQNNNSSTVVLRNGTFVNSYSFMMPLSIGDKSMFKAYCHDDKLYIYPQQDILA